MTAPWQYEESETANFGAGKKPSALERFKAQRVTVGLLLFLIAAIVTTIVGAFRAVSSIEHLTQQHIAEHRREGLSDAHPSTAEIMRMLAERIDRTDNRIDKLKDQVDENTAWRKANELRRDRRSRGLD